MGLDLPQHRLLFAIQNSLRSQETANSHCLEGKEKSRLSLLYFKGKKTFLDFPSFSNKKTILECATEESASKWEIELQWIVLSCLFIQTIHVERFPAETSSASPGNAVANSHFGYSAEIGMTKCGVQCQNILTLHRGDY